MLCIFLVQKSYLLELKKKAFQGWQEYCDEKRHLQELTYLTREATSRRLMTSSWARWRHRVSIVIVHFDAMCKALILYTTYIVILLKLLYPGSALGRRARKYDLSHTLMPSFISI